MDDKDAAQQTQPGGGGTFNNASAVRHVFAYTTDTHKELPVLRRILLVEDDTSLAQLEANILAAHGYNVVTAADGEVAISAFQQTLPDIVLLDLDLAGPLSGWDVLQVVRRSSQVPVLLTSAESSVRRHIRNRGESRGTLDHLPKPYPMQTLLKRVERMLALAQ